MPRETAMMFEVAGPAMAVRWQGDEAHSLTACVRPACWSNSCVPIRNPA